MNERRAISQAALRWNRQHLPRNPWRPSRLAIYTLKICMDRECLAKLSCQRLIYLFTILYGFVQ